MQILERYRELLPWLQLERRTLVRVRLEWAMQPCGVKRVFRSPADNVCDYSSPGLAGTECFAISTCQSDVSYSAQETCT
jgi:hypothetical protein